MKFCAAALLDPLNVIYTTLKTRDLAAFWHPHSSRFS